MSTCLAPKSAQLRCICEIPMILMIQKLVECADFRIHHRNLADATGSVWISELKRDKLFFYSAGMDTFECVETNVTLKQTVFNANTFFKSATNFTSR